MFKKLLGLGITTLLLFSNIIQSNADIVFNSTDFKYDTEAELEKDYVNKKILCFIDYDNVIHTNKLIEIFQNKCILFNTLEPRFNLPINIIIILLKIDGRLEELKGSILEDIKQYKLIDNNYVIEKFILNKSTLIREK